MAVTGFMLPVKIVEALVVLCRLLVLLVGVVLPYEMKQQYNHRITVHTTGYPVSSPKNTDEYTTVL